MREGEQMGTEMRSISEDILLCVQEVRRRRGIILLITVIGLILGILLSLMVRNNAYSAKACLYNGQYGSYYDSVAISNFMKDTQTLAKSYKISEEAVRILGDPSCTVEMMQQAIQVEIDSNSNVVWLVGMSNYPERSVRMVNAFTEALVTEMKAIAGIENVQVLEYAQDATVVYKATSVRLTIALVAALVFGVASSVFFMLRMLFSSAILSIDRCTLNGEINLLGVIPEIKKKEGKE